MATTNNAQGDKSRTTALERQVQTLATAVERLTEQNHDLEKQLRQKNAGLNTQEEDQEGLEGNNALSKLEQQDTSWPSITDTAPPHIVAEMQMMKELMNFMMNALRGRVSSNLDDLVHRTDSPFTASVTSFPFHRSFICYRWKATTDPRNP